MHTEAAPLLMQLARAEARQQGTPLRLKKLYLWCTQHMHTHSTQQHMLPAGSHAHRGSAATDATGQDRGPAARHPPAPEAVLLVHPIQAHTLSNT